MGPSADAWHWSEDALEAANFCVIALIRDGLRVPPFDRHPDGDAALRNLGLDTATWLASVRDRRIADLALRLVHRQWLSVGQRDRAGQLVREALAAGCADPEIIGTHAAQIGRRGTPEALVEAIAICDAALEHRDGSTDEAWTALDARRSQLRSRAARFRVRYKDERDKEGNLVPKRHHHPLTPLRRPPRFEPRAA